jgi:hypothetical protein
MKMQLIKLIVEFIYWLYQLYLTKNEAIDEIIKDERDYELAWEILDTFPEEFIYEPNEIYNQAINWYRSSCTCQWTVGASNVIRKYKKDENIKSPFKLWDILKEKKLGKEWAWAFLIDAIKEAKTAWKIDGYYRVMTIDAIKKALYNTDMIVTWSNKIDWKALQETWYKVDKVSKWSWHAFYICWWNKEGFIAINSYSDKYWLKGKFIIPFDLFLKLAFNSTYAVVVNPEWTKLTRDELYNNYSVTKK